MRYGARHHDVDVAARHDVDPQHATIAPGEQVAVGRDVTLQERTEVDDLIVTIVGHEVLDALAHACKCRSVHVRELLCGSAIAAGSGGGYAPRRRAHQFGSVAVSPAVTFPLGSTLEVDPDGTLAPLAARGVDQFAPRTSRKVLDRVGNKLTRMSVNASPWQHAIDTRTGRRTNGPVERAERLGYVTHGEFGLRSLRP